MKILKQSAAVTINLGPFVDDTDGKTAETALTIAQANVQLSKNFGAYAQKGDTGSATHKVNGIYGVPLNATDVGTLGPLDVSVHVAGALPVWDTYYVVPAHVYDALVTDTGNLLRAAEHNAMADALLKRDWTLVSGEAARSMLNALRFLRNFWTISGSTLTVKKEDDTTDAWTAALSTTQGANPVTQVDPT